MKNTGNIGGTFKFVCEVHCSLFFFCYKVYSIPLILKKYIFISNVILFIFQFFFQGRREKNCQILTKKKKALSGDDFDHQTY